LNFSDASVREAVDLVLGDDVPYAVEFLNEQDLASYESVCIDNTFHRMRRIAALNLVLWQIGYLARVVDGVVVIHNAARNVSSSDLCLAKRPQWSRADRLATSRGRTWADFDSSGPFAITVDTWADHHRMNEEYRTANELLASRTQRRMLLVGSDEESRIHEALLTPTANLGHVSTVGDLADAIRREYQINVFVYPGQQETRLAWEARVVSQYKPIYYTIDDFASRSDHVTFDVCWGTCDSASSAGNLRSRGYV